MAAMMPSAARKTLTLPAELAPEAVAALRSALLDWYDIHARELPWRVGPARNKAGVRQTPYRVWLSEIMLQQTTVAAVAPRFAAFLKAAKSIDSLADLPVERVMELWAGLGYYARARNLHACAKEVAARGGFPHDLEGLRALPGVGDYTARAIAAIAFDAPFTPVDGNVERVLSRLLQVEEPLPKAKPLFQHLASAFDGGERPGDFAQALMDLGATICTPKAPACARCPWAGSCKASKAGSAGDYPRKIAKMQRPERAGAVAFVTDGTSVLLKRRPETGLLGGMLELPGTEWTQVASGRRALVGAPLPGTASHCGTVKHVFTHFTLYLDVWRVDAADLAAVPFANGLAIPISELDTAALPTVMRKAVALGLGGVTRLPV